MNEIINKTDGTILKWTKTPDNNYFCLLYSDNKNNYSFTPTTNLNCKLFMIGGGGAGGYYFGGGGGAGAAYYNENFNFKKGITYNFSIGNGGKCDIQDINSLFSQGLTLNIYNNVNIDFNNISFTLDDYSSLNINNSGLIQNFVVNTYDTNVNIPNSIWNNNTFYIWSGYIIPTSTDEYIKININTNINTAIWIDNYIYNNQNTLILNTNNNYYNDVKIIKIDPKRYYNIKIIAYCNNNNSNNNFNISFSNNCSLYNYNKDNEKYIYLNATDTTLNFNDPSLDKPINTFTCNGGGNGGCGFFNQNTNLDGGCGGGSGINKKNGNTLVNTSIYKGTNGAVGTFCGGGGGIISTGKDNMGGDGLILNWFDNKLFFGCGGNGGNSKDDRNRGYGCGGNGGDCCYYSKEIINNNGKNGCVIIYINSSTPPVIEKFTDQNTYYSYITDPNKVLNITNVIYTSINQITNISYSGNIGIGTNNPPSIIGTDNADGFTKYAGYVRLYGNGAANKNISYPSFPDRVVLYGTFPNNIWTPGKDIFFNYFKYNPIYIYDILCLHKCLIALYKIMYYQIDNNPNDTSFYTDLKIEFVDNPAIQTRYDSSTKTIYLNNIFNINSNQFTCTVTDDTYDIANDNSVATINSTLKNSDQYLRYFYGCNTSSLDTANSLNIAPQVFNYKYNDATYNYSVPLLPFYNSFNTTNSRPTSLNYIKDYLINDFLNTIDRSGSGSSSTKIRSSSFMNSILGDLPMNYQNICSVIDEKYANYINNTPPIPNTIYYYSRHDIEIQILFLDFFRLVLNPDNKDSICGALYYYCNLFNLIIMNLNLQYGFYRLLMSRFNRRPYINLSDESKVRYFTHTGPLSENPTQSVPSTSNLTNEITYSIETIEILKILFKNYNKISDTTAIINDTNIQNYTKSNDLIKSQLKLNKIIKKYNDELQIYNTTVNIYKALIALFIVLLIIILYIFTIDSNTLSKTSKVSIFFILGILLLGASVYFIYNNNIIYENFNDNDDHGNNNIIETFANPPADYSNIHSYGMNILYCKTFNSDDQSKFTIVSKNSYDIFGNAPNNYYNNLSSYQGLITNTIYLANLLTVIPSTTRLPELNFSSDINFTSYNRIIVDFYSLLRYYILSTFNISNNAMIMVNDIANLVQYKNKRINFYDNRYDFYVNSIEALKNNKYVYYYLSILFALCSVLLLLSLSIILIFGHSMESIIITSIISFLIVLIIVYYIYFKLHQRTRLKVDKKYWAYNNPSNETLNKFA